MICYLYEQKAQKILKFRLKLVVIHTTTWHIFQPKLKKGKKNLSEKISYILYIFSKKVFLIFLGKKVSYVSLRNVLPTFWDNQIVKKKKKKKVIHGRLFKMVN